MFQLLFLQKRGKNFGYNAEKGSYSIEFLTIRKK